MSGDTLDLFDAPPSPGVRDTSAEAGERIARSVKGLRGRVLRAVRAAGEVGATGSELSASLGIGLLTVRPRLTELRGMGLIGDTGRRRRPEAGRCSEIVWRGEPEAGER